MTAREFADRMEEIFKSKSNNNFNDVEDAHLEADELMAEVLSSLGYEEGVKIFFSHEKWYA